MEFVTGSDEHGLKIQQVAAKEGRKEEQVVKKGAARFVVSATYPSLPDANAESDEERRSWPRRRTYR